MFYEIRCKVLYWLCILFRIKDVDDIKYKNIKYLKTQYDVINKYFSKNYGVEFISFEDFLKDDVKLND